MKPTLTAIASCMALSACSFNTVNNYGAVTSDIPSAVVVEVRDVPKPKQESSQATVEKPPVVEKIPLVTPKPPPAKVLKMERLCTNVVFPKLPKAPKPPTELIEKIDPADKVAINKVLLHYLEELATHVTQVKKNYATVRNNYKVKCGG